MKSRKNKTLTRREVLQNTGRILPAGLVASTFLSSHPVAAEEKMPQRVLGGTGKKLSLLTLGTGHFRSSLDIEVEQVEKILDRAVKLGVNSIDTAPNYSESEELLGHVLKPYREKLFLATKTESPTYEGTWELLRRSLKRLQTEYLDLVYIHNWGMEDRFPDEEQVLGEKGTLGALKEAKKQGVIRHIGVSGHFYPSRFKTLLEREEIEVYMCAVNFVARHVYNFEEKVFQPAASRDRGLVAMKVIGGPANWREGTARVMPDYLETAIRYAAQIPQVTTLNIGFRSVEELEQSAQIIKSIKPFTEKEQNEVNELGKEMAKEWKAVYGEPVT